MARSESLSEDLLQQAADWFVLLRSGEADAAALEALRRWRAAHADHERAWQRAEVLMDRLDRVPAQGAGLLQRRSRRRRLATLGTVVLVGIAILGLQRMPATTERPIREYRTAVGERESFGLPDGSRLMLNTASRVTELYDAGERRLRLDNGEILIETAADSQTPSRPLSIETAHGRVHALGTRFEVREDGSRSQVIVHEGRVRIEPLQAGATQTLLPGQRGSFDRSGSLPPQALRVRDGAWSRGVLIADAEPLCEFVVELGRYRSETLLCDPALANRRLSGSFPIDDSDRLLAAVGAALDIRIERLSADRLLFRPR